MQSSTTSPSSPPSHTHTITPPTSNAGPSTPSPSHDSATAGTVTGPYSTYTMPPLIPIAGPNPTGAGQLDPNRGLPPSLHLITASTILEFLVHHSAGRGGSYTSPNNGGKWYHWQDLYEVVAGASVVIPQEVWEAALKGQSTYAEIGAGLRALGAWMQRHEGIEGVLGTREALKGREREVFTGRELGTLWREVCYHSLRLNGGLRRPKGESVPPLDESSMDRMLALSVEGFEKETGGMQGWKGLAEKKKRRLLMDMLKWLTQWSLHYMRMDTNGTIGNSRLSWGALTRAPQSTTQQRMR
ncbi:MAG: hypothetical protein M1820_002052 [Bogoriella megaspora]|nr:MAG: hypothetical protein M1820_002052 [Bogoriella megaspora]